MLFTKNTISLLTGALMATSAMGELTQVTRRAAEGHFKRALSKREDKFVEMGDWDYGQDEDTITTDGLATCMGAAIVGDCPEEGEICEDRWLAHATAVDLAPLEELAVQAQEAVDNGLTNVRISAIFMDPYQEEDDYVEAAEEVNEEALEILEGFYGSEIEPTLHAASEIWALTINSDKSFSSGPVPDSENDSDESMEDFYDEYD